MKHKFVSFPCFFWVIVGCLLLLAACAPQTNDSAQQTKSEPASVAPFKAGSGSDNQVGTTPSTRSGSLVSTLIKKLTSIKISGSLEKQSPAAWVVSGKTVLLSPSTQIEGDPGPQSQINVSGFLEPGGTLLAHRISISNMTMVLTREITATGTFEIAGIVSSILPDAWVIGTQEVQVDAHTEFESGLVVGSLAEAEGYILSDGSYLAREISKVSEPSEMSEVEFTGVLTAINANNTWIVNAITVIVALETEIDGNPQVGDTVTVEGHRQADGSVLAHEIEIVSDELGTGEDDQRDEDDDANGDDSDTDDDSDDANDNGSSDDEDASDTDDDGDDIDDNDSDDNDGSDTDDDSDDANDGDADDDNGNDDDDNDDEVDDNIDDGNHTDDNSDYDDGGEDD